MNFHFVTHHVIFFWGKGASNCLQWNYSWRTKSLGCTGWAIFFFSNYEKCTWTYKGSAPVSDLTWWELDVFLTNSGGSSQVSCMHALKCRRSKNAASDSESVTLTTWLWSHNSEHLTLIIWIWSPDSDHLTLITWLLSHDSDQLTLTTWLWSPDCTWGLVGTKLAGCRPDWTSSLCVAPTAI